MVGEVGANDVEDGGTVLGERGPAHLHGEVAARVRLRARGGQPFGEYGAAGG